jgi:hypothetical protein
MPEETRTRCEHPERLGRYCSACGQLVGLDPVFVVKDPSTWPIALLVLASAASSIAALLLHAAGIVRMPYTISFVTLPGTVLLVTLLVWTRRTERTLLFNRLKVGLVAGAVGLVFYDAARLVVQSTIPLGFNAFMSLPAYGSLMTGKPVSSGAAHAAGWAYHISNGLTFGVIYSVIAGPARWYWGLAWGGILEGAMVVVFPTILKPASFKGFLVVNMIGHAAFGAGVGLWCRRHAMAATT